MPVSVKEHYDGHLAPLYSWTCGGAESARTRFAALLNDLGLRPTRPGATALDLGAGSGFQALPLAAAGYTVTAVDLSEVLLAELRRDADAGELLIRTIVGDLRTFTAHVPFPAPEIIVCFGDTLPHLSSLQEIEGVIHDAAKALAPGGYLLLGFRDYSVARNGSERFIPVRSDPDRILTCFLEYTSDKVVVHDLIHTRNGQEWRLTISAYEKLRLPPRHVGEQIVRAGLQTIRDSVQNGLVTLIARKPLLF